MKLKKTFLLLALALVGMGAVAQEKIDYSVYEDKCNFYIANDLGRNVSASSPPATCTTSRASSPRKTPCG